MTMQLRAEQLEELKEAFKYFDKDGNGKLTTDELSQIMQSMEEYATKAELQLLINQVNCDGNDSISFDDFVAMMLNNQATHDEKENEVREAFQMFDRDQNGFITADEFLHVLLKLGLKYTDDEVKEIIFENDTDGDGKINYDEFEAMMTKNSIF